MLLGAICSYSALPCESVFQRCLSRADACDVPREPGRAPGVVSSGSPGHLQDTRESEPR